MNNKSVAINHSFIQWLIAMDNIGIRNIVITDESKMAYEALHDMGFRPSGNGIKVSKADLDLIRLWQSTLSHSVDLRDFLRAAKL